MADFENLPPPPPPIIPPQGVCREASTDSLVEGRRLWSTNYCHNSLFGMGIREPQEFTPGTPEYVKPGYWEPVSESPIRAVPKQATAYEDACRFHFGHMMVGANGYWEPWMCSEVAGAEDSKRCSRMKAHVKEEGTNGRQPTGYWFFAAAHQGPRWTEAHYSSYRRRCGIL